MSDLAEFLAARLDEEEAAAREAADGDSGAWFMGNKWNIYRTEDEARSDEDYQGDEHKLVAYGNVKPQSAHIARHHPARVLREVAAMRAIIGDEDDGLALYAVHERGVWPEELTRAADQILRLLAAIWSDHPDYRPEWASGE